MEQKKDYPDNTDGGSSSASGSEESGKRNIKNSTARGMIFPGSAVSVRKIR